MIELVTIFNGLLILGVVPVELQADPRVVAVELRLDSRTVARKEAPPWVFEVDFGPTLLPHALEGIALGPDGAEVDRTEAPVNAEQSPLLLEFRIPRGETWPPRRMRVLAEGVPGAPPSSPKVWQDSRLLLVDPEGFFAIRAPEGRASKLRAVVRAAGLELERDLVLGGARSRQSTTTAISLEVPPGTFFQPSGWLVAGGREVEVVRAHRPPAAIALIWDGNLPYRFSRQEEDEADQGVEHPGGIHVWKVAPGHGERITVTEGVQRSGPDRGVLGVIRRLDRKKPRRDPVEQEIFDAVAAAGVQLARSGRPRAALLLLDAASRDMSDFELQEVADFLAVLQVPFCVWIHGREASSAEKDHGFCIDDNLPRLVRSMEASLERQHIAVLAGRPLPQTLAFSASAPSSVRFAGR